MVSYIFEIFIEICVCLSAISELLLIYGFIKVPEIRKYPGKFILGQCIFQFFLDIHWLSSLNNLSFLHNEKTCKVIGALCIAFEIQAWLCNLYICIEVVKKMNSPKLAKRKRFKVYVIISVFMFLFTVLTLSLGNQSGLSDIKTCSIEYRSYYNIFQLVTLLFFVPICMVLAFWCLNKGKSNPLLTKTLRYHIYVVITFTASLLPSMINGALSFPFSQSNLQIPIFLEVSITLGSLSGFFTFVARMWQKGLAKLYFQALCCFSSSKNSETFKISLLDINPYTNFFSAVERTDDIQSIIKCIEFSYKFPKSGQVIEDGDIQWFYIEKSRKMKILKKNPKIFDDLRKRRKYLNDFEKEFEHFQDLIINENPEVSEDFYFSCYTKSKKFRVVCVTSDDFKNFIQVAKVYVNQAAREYSFLVGIFDLFCISFSKTSSLYLMVIENPINSLENGEKKILIDAKGHLPDIPSNLSGTGSFLSSNPRLKIRQKDLSQIQKQVTSDTRTLSSFNFLSYSLILCQSSTIPSISYYLINEKPSILYLEISFSSHSISFFNKTNYRDEFLQTFSQLFQPFN